MNAPRFSVWSALAVTLALLGPLVMALLSSGPRGAASVSTQIAAIALIGVTTTVAAAVAVLLDGCRLRDLGFATVSWWSIPLGLVLATFFIVIFGPAMVKALACAGLGGFDAGVARIAVLPTWLLVLTILIVAPAEEFLYRAYAIERLGPLLGSRPMAGLVAVTLFFLAHVPLWGWGAALTTAASGAILTAVYLMRADVVSLMIAHVATDLFGLVIAPYLTRLNT